MFSTNFTNLRPHQTSFMNAQMSQEESVQCLTTLQNYLQELQNGADVSYVKFADVVDYKQPTKYIVESTEYSDDYSIPVLTAGKGFLLGYTNETDGVYPASPENPVILFDDFTTAVQWVDFPFKVKSSAMKLLTTKDKSAKTLRYVFQGIKNTFFVPTEHKRHWISTFADLEIKWPEAKVREAIADFYAIGVANAASLDAEIQLRKIQFNYFLDQILSNQRKEYICLSESDNSSEFADASTNYTITKLGNLCFGISTGTYLTKRIKEDAEKPQEELIYPVYGSSGIVRYGSSYSFDGTKILVSCIGSNTGIVHLAHGKFDVNQNSLIIDLDESKCDFNYLQYYLKTRNLVRFANGGAQKCLTATSVRNLEVELPPIEQQHNIGNFFSTFDSYINNLEQELSLREQQLEFYLKKLFDQL